MIHVEPIDIDRHNDVADKQEADMIDGFTVLHCEHVSQRSFEAVVAAFERATGDALTQMAANISVSAAGKP